MARTRKVRRIEMAPHFQGFKPSGIQNARSAEVIISFEEYEAIKLCDYELLTQSEAAEMMRISRPTFTRLYETARRKIAKAFVEGCQVRFEGGNFETAGWYRCEDCNITFTLTRNAPKICPFCKTGSIKLLT